MKIIRFSDSGFSPQYQDYHLRSLIWPLLNYFYNRDFPLYSKARAIFSSNHQYFKRLAQFIYENEEDFEYGIWAFIDGHVNNASLNHLNKRVSVWKAEIPDHIYVYDVNLNEKYLITDKRAQFFGFFIPSKELKFVSDVKKIG